MENKRILYNNHIGHSIGSNSSFLVFNQEVSNLVNQALTLGALRYLFPINYNAPDFLNNPLTPEPDDGNHGIISLTQLIPTNQ